MRPLTRIAEALHAILLFVGLVGPLGFFFYRVLTVDGFLLFFSDKPTQAALFNSLSMALTTGVLSTAIAFVTSWLLWRYRWPSRAARALGLFLKIPYLLPPFFFAMGWIALAAPNVGY